MIEAEYAKALFELASEKDNKEILEELNILLEALNENAEAWQIFNAPNISDKEKKDIISNITKDYNELTKRFLYVLVDNKRINSLKDIIGEYNLLINNSVKAVDVYVTSKYALSSDKKNVLSNLLSTKLDGRKVKIINIVDNNLIGGVKCVYDGKLIDLSVRGKINQIKNLL